MNNIKFSYRTKILKSALPYFKRKPSHNKEISTLRISQSQMKKAQNHMLTVYKINKMKRLKAYAENIYGAV